jgi:16S rRNA (guanine527-N7)-methyltransferase
VSDADTAAIAAVATVSRETLDRLSAYADLIRRWNKAENLIAPGDLPDLWRRHFADCAQLPALLPGARSWIDVGSGAGLPGVVIALVGPPRTTVALVESNRRRAAFLRQAIRATGASASVHEGRAEAVLANWSAPADCVTARAVAPLDRLLATVETVLTRGVPGLFPKGRDADREIDEATHSWRFDLVKHPSRVGEGGVILEIRNLRRRQ